jgi:iron complex transport system permease protein
VTRTAERRVGVPPAARRVLLAVVLVVALLVAVLVSLSVGQLSLSVNEVLGAIGRGLQLAPAVSDPEARIADATVQVVRVPRIALAVLVGAALGTAGTVMQAIFGNPLAEPGIVGVSSGAAAGAALAIVLGTTVLGEWSVAAFAFIGGLAAALIVYVVSRSQGRTELVTLILTGVAVSAFAGAALSLLLFLADASSREQIVFWQLGSLNGALWSEVWVVLPVVLVATGVAIALARQYDLLALGERSARHLGVDVERLRIGSIVLVALLAGAAVAFCGIISFVGLVAPHAVRMVIGPAHRPLLISSALMGAVLVLVADTLARTLVPAGDLPIGILTALVGGPFFFVLLLQQRTRNGGWA